MATEVEVCSFVHWRTRPGEQPATGRDRRQHPGTLGIFDLIFVLVATHHEIQTLQLVHLFRGPCGAPAEHCEHHFRVQGAAKVLGQPES